RRHTCFSRDWSSDVCSSDLKTFCKELEELGFIERWQTRKENGDFGKMHYRLKAAFPAPADEADQTEEEKSRSAKIAPREKPRSRSEERRVGIELMYSRPREQ